jgi:ATP/maltotriose-dependent transcriptional regulator MalT
MLFAAQVDQGNAAQQRGDFAAARRFWQEGLVTTRASGAQACEAPLLMNLGRLQIFEGNYAAGRAQCEEALDLARQVGDVWVVWHALNALALAALAQGDLATARALAYEGLNLKADPTWQTRELHVLGQIAIAEGEYTAARGHLLHALELLASSDDPVATAEVVETLGHLASRDLRDRWLIPLRQTLKAEDEDRWWAEGYALSLDEAVVLAQSAPFAAASLPDLSNAPALDGPVPRRQLDVAGLTAREAEVLRLVAKGQSNKEIAAELVLSVRTVERHITNLYGKIDARGKADATAYAFHHGLV